MLLDGKGFSDAELGSKSSIPLVLHNKELILLEKIQLRYQTVDWECKELEISSLKGTERASLSLDIRLDAIWNYNLKMVFHERDFLGNDRYFKTPEAPFSVSIDGLQIDGWENRLMEDKVNQLWSLRLMPSTEKEWAEFLGQKGAQSQKYAKAQRQLQQEWKSLAERRFLKEAEAWYQALYKADEFHLMLLDIGQILRSQVVMEDRIRERSQNILNEAIQALHREQEALQKSLQDNLSQQKIVEKWDQILAKPELLKQNESLFSERRMQLLIAEWKRSEKDEPDLSEVNEIQRLWEKRHDDRIERLRDRENSLDKDEKRLERYKKEFAELEGKLFSMFSSKKIEDAKKNVARVEKRIEDWKTRISNNNTNRAEDAKKSKKRKEEAINKAKKKLQAQIDYITKKLIEIVEEKRKEALMMGKESLSDINALQKKEAELREAITQEEGKQKLKIAALEKQSAKERDEQLEKILAAKSAFTEQQLKTHAQLQRFEYQVPESFHQNLKRYYQLVPMKIFRTYFFFYPEKQKEFEDTDDPASVNLLHAILALSELRGAERVERLSVIPELILDYPDWENSMLLKVGSGHPYQTIGEALEKAPSGAVISIDQGTYREDIEITKDVHLIGSHEARLRSAKGASSESHIRCSVNKLVDVSIFDCDIYSNASTAGLVFGGLCSTTIVHCKISSQNFEGKTDSLVEKNDIYQNTASGVFIWEGANPTIRRNKLHHNKVAGCSFRNEGGGLIEKNDVFENKDVQILIRSKSDPIIKDNRIYKGGSLGISVYEQGKGRVLENDIFQNAYSGIKIADGSTALIENNKIHDNGEHGVWGVEGAHGVVLNNQIYNTNSKFKPIKIVENASTIVRDNIIK